MEYNSFYGGRQGAPFIITGRFERVNNPIYEEDRIRIYFDLDEDEPITSEQKITWRNHIIRISLFGEDEDQPLTEQQIDDWVSEKCMIPAFKKGDSYKIINYDEYVLIDTINKNDEDNGKVYQRGRNYQEDDGDAQYIGQIVGPSGPTPHTFMTTMAEVDEKAALGDSKERRKSEGRYAPVDNLVPGAKGTENNRTFDNTTDSIQYSMVSIRDKNGHDAEIYVGFKFPYTIIDFYTNWVEPYVNHQYTDTSDVIRQDDKTHPYYEQWELLIPKGIKGDSLKDFSIMADAGVSANPRWVDPTIQGNEDKPKHLVYKLYNYDLVDNPSPEYIDLGPYHIIRNIQLATSGSTSGTITVNYEDNIRATFSKALTWITNITLNPETGLFKITYNNDKINNSTTYTANLKWVKGLSVSEDGIVTISYTYNNGESTDVPITNMKIKYVDHITLNENNNGKLKIYYNTKTNNVQDTDELDLVWVSSVELANNGALTYLDSKGISHSLGSIKWITDSKVLTESDIIADPSSFANNTVGDFVIKFNTDNNYTTLTNIKFISNVKGTSGYLQVDYNNGDPSTFIWQGTTNSTGAIMSEETSEPEPVFAEGSPWFIVEEILPYKRKLSYIESTGSQYIDLNTDINNSLFEAQIKIQLTDPTNACNIFGAKASGQNETFYVVNEYNSSQNYWRYYHYIPGYGYGFQFNNEEPADVSILRTGIRIHNNSNNYDYFHDSNGYVQKDSLAKIDTLYLLNVKNKTGNYAPAKLYSFKLYKDNILTMDLIPVMDKNDIPCLYDEVSGEFFYNAGSGNFLYGEVE